MYGKQGTSFYTAPTSCTSWLLSSVLLPFMCNLLTHDLSHSSTLFPPLPLLLPYCPSIIFLFFVEKMTTISNSRAAAAVFTLLPEQKLKYKKKYLSFCSFLFFPSYKMLLWTDVWSLFFLFLYPLSLSGSFLFWNTILQGVSGRLLGHLIKLTVFFLLPLPPSLSFFMKLPLQGLRSGAFLTTLFWLPEIEIP